MYVKVSSQLTSGIIEEHIYAAGGYGAPGKRRRKRKNISPEIKEKHNALQRERKIQKLIIMNFSEGWHIILRYPKDDQPEDYEEAESRFRRFRENISRELKKYDIPFRYIVVTETGKKENHYHHHIIVESLWDKGIDMKALVREKWRKFGTTSHSKLYDEGNYEDLAKYLAKSDTKEEQRQLRKEGRNVPVYKCSRNLKKPKIIKKETYYGDIREPEAPKGWFVDAGSLIQGTNPYTGKKFQRYFIKNTPEKVIERALALKEEKDEKPARILPEVNLYIESAVRNGEGECIYILEYIKKDGTPITKDATAHYKGSKQGLTLRALIAGVSLLKSDTRIKVFTSDPVVRSALKNRWPEKWEKQKWNNGKGKAVQCAGLWKYIKENAWNHEYTVPSESEKNTYHEWSLRQLEKAAAEHDKAEKKGESK